MLIDFSFFVILTFSKHPFNNHIFIHFFLQKKSFTSGFSRVLFFEKSQVINCPLECWAHIVN